MRQRGWANLSPSRTRIVALIPVVPSHCIQLKAKVGPHSHRTADTVARRRQPSSTQKERPEELHHSSAGALVRGRTKESGTPGRRRASNDDGASRVY